jgi:ParB/RepB/Spo0J family partition protein
MPTQSPTRRERRAAVTDGVFRPLPQREILRGVGETENRLVPIHAISPNPDNRHIDVVGESFRDLVGSIRQEGLLQHINLWQLDDVEERYRLIAGERRWRAYLELEQEDPVRFGRIPALVTLLERDQPEANALLLGLIENINRLDLKPGERAAALGRLRERTGWTYEEVARRMGISVNTVIGLAGIARHDAVRSAVDDGRITQEQAVVIGQGTRDPELAGALVEVVYGLDRQQTAQTLAAARAADPTLPAPQRAQQAVAQVQAVAVLPPRPAPDLGPMPIERIADIPRTAGGRRTHPVRQRYVILANTALAALHPRVAELERERLAQVLQEVCEETNIWPRRPRRK